MTGSGDLGYREESSLEADAAPHEHGKWFWVGAVLGWIVMGIGVVGMFSDADLTAPRSFLVWFVGSALVHDLIWLPVALTVGLFVGRHAPRRVRAPLAWLLATAAVLASIGMPFILGYGRDRSVPSLLPRNYAVGLLVYIAVAAVMAVAWWMLIRLRSR